MNENTLGYLDNETTNFEKYRKRLQRREIKLLCKNGKPTMQEVVDWLVENEIKCFMVDYKLEPQFSYQGTDLLFYIKSALPDLPCIILTNYKSDSLTDNLVEEFVVFDRHTMDSTGEDFDKFIDTLKRTLKIFDKRIQKRIEYYEELLSKHNSENITVFENEEFLKNYSLLRSYGVVDEIPSELLTSKVEKSLDSLLEELDEVLDSVEEK